MRTNPPCIDDLIGYAVVIEAEMPQRLREGGVEDWVFDDNCRHATLHSLNCNKSA